MTNQATQVLAPVLPDEDDVLAFTHATRLDVLKQMFTGSNGQTKLPEDPADRKTIVSILKDMDGQALGRKRIKVEEKINSNQEQAAGLIAQVLNATAGHSAFRIQSRVPRAAPVLPDDIPNPVLVDGETETSTSSMNYEDFVVAMAPADEQPA